MADLFSWTKLGLENFKTILTIWMFLLSLIGGNIWQYFESESMTKEAKSYKMGYEALAQNINHKPDKPIKVDNHTHPKLEKRIKRLEGRHF